MKKGWWNIKNGQSLVEILVSLGIFSLVLTSIFTLFFGGRNLSVDSATAQNAAEYASEGLEAIRTMRDRDWTSLADGQHGLVLVGGQWEFTTTTDSDSRDIFTRVVHISEIDENTKQASSSVTWQVDPLRPQKIELFERLTNWRNPLSGGCVSDPISGNWQAPQTLSSIDLGAGISGTDVVVRLPYVFVAGKSSTSAKHDLFVFDVSNLSSPQLRKSLDIGSGGIETIELSGGYLYAASTNDNKELIIFNVMDPPNMFEVGSYNLTGSANAISIAIFSSTTAVGRLETAASELAFLEVSDPSQPYVIREVSTGGDIHDFYVNLTTLYFVSQQSDEDIFIYDITDPLNPVFADDHDIAGTTEDLSIFMQIKNGKTNLLVGNEQNEIVVIGATSTEQYVRDRLDVGGDVNDIVCVEGDLAFLATGNSNKEFTIVNVGDPDNISEYASLNFPQVAGGIDYASNTVFMVLRSNDALRIIGPGP